MHLTLKKRASGDIVFGLIYGTIAILALIAVRFLPVLELMPSCVFRAFTGIPCPTCGATRSLVHLANGNLSASFGMNPAIALLMFAALLMFVYDVATLFSGSRISLSLTPREATLMRAGAVVVLLANWAYLALSL
ncbi:MAG: hypothetical protein H6Q97_430 [Nitrospirae bacterium]|nr:hypothetical protein [Nitrospirota bacterium]MBS1192451.1 hypothetical protein [Nitrospirota bacterium]